MNCKQFGITECLMIVPERGRRGKLHIFKIREREREREMEKRGVVLDELSRFFPRFTERIELGIRGAALKFNYRSYRGKRAGRR